MVSTATVGPMCAPLFMDVKPWRAAIRSNPKTVKAAAVDRILVILLQKGDFEVDDPAFAHDPGDFRHEGAFVRKMLDDARGDGKVDRAIGEGKPGNVGHEIDAGNRQKIDGDHLGCDAAASGSEVHDDGAGWLVGNDPANLRPALPSQRRDEAAVVLLPPRHFLISSGRRRCLSRLGWTRSETRPVHDDAGAEWPGSARRSAALR